jgi:hypothetical protein
VKRLLLHFRADCNTNDIWRAAIRSGWSTERIHDVIPPSVFEGASKVRYYGNTLHASRIADTLPFTFTPLDLTVLTKTPLTKRRVEMIRLDSLTVIDKPTFIKPAQEKWFPARVYQPGELPAPEGGTLPSDLIYVQDPIDMINEVRCFCLDGKILTASYYRIGHEYCPVGIDEVDRPKVLDEMVAELAPMYPRGVVLDFAYTSGRKWAFIEPNEAWASGVYGCDPERYLEVIEASQEDR